MRLVFCVVSVMAALFLSGCEAVFTQQPLGDEVVKLDRDLWQGTWLGDEVVVLTTVLDDDKGLLQAAWVERGQDGARFEAVTGSVRRSGDVLFLNMEHQKTDADTASDEAAGRPGDHSGFASEYYWARIENDGRKAVFWWPDVGRIRLAVQQGSLPGRIEQDQDVILGPLDATQLARINDPSSGLLDWSRPVTLIRIGD